LGTSVGVGVGVDVLVGVGEAVIVAVGDMVAVGVGVGGRGVDEKITGMWVGVALS
jgi:hypothetical protein